LRTSEADKVAVVTAGITLIEALKAHDELKKEGIGVRVIDAYSVQPLDRENILKNAVEAGSRVIVVEDHFEGGGLGDAVASALAGKAALKHLCIRELPRSGTPAELMDRFGISARHIVAAAKDLLAQRT